MSKSLLFPKINYFSDKLERIAQLSTSAPSNFIFLESPWHSALIIRSSFYSSIIVLSSLLAMISGYLPPFSSSTLRTAEKFYYSVFSDMFSAMASWSFWVRSIVWFLKYGFWGFLTRLARNYSVNRKCWSSRCFVLILCFWTSWFFSIFFTCCLIISTFSSWLIYLLPRALGTIPSSS